MNKEIKENEIKQKPLDTKKQEEKKTVEVVGKKIEGKKEEPVKKESLAPKTVVEEKGINLIPSMSDEEIFKEDRKKKVSVSSLISVSVLLSVSILVVGFNIISRIQLNAQNNKLVEKEKNIQEYTILISGNTEILERVLLYEDIQEGRFSTKLVVDYFQNLASRSGSIQLHDFAFQGSKAFEFSGNSQGLEDVAKFWYLLSNDENIEEVTLKSVSRSEEGASFSFTGNMRIEEFTQSVNTINNSQKDGI